jgi:ankyrin repeat protein
MANNLVEILALVKRQINARDKYGNTPLILASRDGRTAIAQELPKRGANPNAANNYGNTALILASRKGHKNVVKALLDKRANPNAVNKYGNSALMLASHPAIAQLLEPTPQLALIKRTKPRASPKNG